MKSDPRVNGQSSTSTTPIRFRDSVARARKRIEELGWKIDQTEIRIDKLERMAPSFAPPSDLHSREVLQDEGARLAWWERIHNSEPHQRWLKSEEREESQRLAFERDQMKVERSMLESRVRVAERWSASIGTRASGWTLDSWVDRPGHASDETHAPFRERVRSAAMDWLRDLVMESSKSSTCVIAARGTGAGKTHLACAMGRELAFRSRSVVFQNVPRMFSSVRGSFHDDRRSTAIDDAAACDVLILDDLGRHRGSAWEVEQLYNLLDAREVAGSPTIITTNVQLSHSDSESWRRAVGGTGYQSSQSWEVEAAASRLQGGATLVACVSLARADGGSRKVVEWPDIRGTRNG